MLAIRHKITVIVLLFTLFAPLKVRGDVAAPAGTSAKVAEWTLVTYIQADNDLAPFAEHNIQDMERVATHDKVNVLVQWDKPRDNKTWRYKIENGKRIDAGTLNQEMGVNPEHELVEMMRWAHDNYPAKKYMMVLWNHGNGVLDRSNNNRFTLPSPWLKVPGFSTQSIKRSWEKRGILYDDSDFTFLDNEALTRVLQKTNEILGKKLDVLGMDACFMAMAEIAYLAKDHAHYLVGAEHTEPGEGWSYSGFLTSLVSAPHKFAAKDLAKSIVLAYGSYYADYAETTQSAIKLENMNALKEGTAHIVHTLEKIQQYDREIISSLIEYIRKRVIKFANPDYVDLYSLYGFMNRKAYSLGKRSTISRECAQLLGELRQAIREQRKLIRSTVYANVVGQTFAGARGISVYFPAGPVDSDYATTSFAVDTNWTAFANMF